MIGKKRDTIAHTTVEYHRARRRLGRERDLEKVGTTFGSPLGLDLRLPRNPLKVTTSIYNLILGKLYCEHYGTMHTQGNQEYSCKLKFKKQSIIDRNPHQVLYIYCNDSIFSHLIYYYFH
ncbi:hypothetical protein GLYMA_19G041525v4 [Glycine max]|nr:hypothetical protein GLYMA_19G041525v4 [Glycine max]KAH1076338.1 hypothetical protein GYH30_052004 [Glycine max]